MPKRRPNEEIFLDDGREIRMVADFGFLVAVNEAGRDVSAVYTDLANGLMPPCDVQTVLACAAVLPDNVDRLEFVADLITRYGLQECSIMARVMLSHAMIGDVKKSALDRGAAVQGLLESLTGDTRLTTLWRLGWFSAAITVTSTALVCTIFSTFGPPT